MHFRTIVHVPKIDMLRMLDILGMKRCETGNAVITYRTVTDP